MFRLLRVWIIIGAVCGAVVFCILELTENRQGLPAGLRQAIVFEVIFFFSFLGSILGVILGLITFLFFPRARQNLIQPKPKKGKQRGSKKE